MIRVGLVDDQALIREGIAQLIELSGKASTEWQCENGEECYPQSPQLGAIHSADYLCATQSMAKIKCNREENHRHALVCCRK